MTAARERARAIVLDMAPFADAEASGATLLVEDLGYDSLGLIELATVIERELELEPISNADTGEVTTILDVEELVERLSHDAHVH
jgi:acyl carrier protein